MSASASSENTGSASPVISDDGSGSGSGSDGRASSSRRNSSSKKSSKKSSSRKRRGKGSVSAGGSQASGGSSVSRADLRRRRQTRRRTVVSIAKTTSGGGSSSPFSAGSIGQLYAKHPLVRGKKWKRNSTDANGLANTILGDVSDELLILKNVMYVLLAEIIEEDPEDAKKTFFMPKPGAPETKAATKERKEKNSKKKGKKKADATDYPAGMYLPGKKKGDPKVFSPTLYQSNRVIHAVCFAAGIAPGDVDSIATLARVALEEDNFNKIFSGKFERTEGNDKKFFEDLLLAGDVAQPLTEKDALYFARMAACAMHLDTTGANKIIAAIMQQLASKLSKSVSFHCLLPALAYITDDMIIGLRYLLPTTFYDETNDSQDEGFEPYEMTIFGVYDPADIPQKDGKPGKLNKTLYPASTHLGSALIATGKASLKDNTNIRDMLGALASKGTTSSWSSISKMYRSLLESGWDNSAFTGEIIKTINSLAGLCFALSSEDESSSQGSGIAGIKQATAIMFRPNFVTAFATLLCYVPTDLLDHDLVADFIAKDVQQTMNYVKSEATTSTLVTLLGTILTGV